MATTQNTIIKKHLLLKHKKHIQDKALPCYLLTDFLKRISKTSIITTHSGKGHVEIFNSGNFENKEKFAAYVLDFLKTQHNLSPDGLTVLKTCLSISCHQINYSLLQEPTISYCIATDPFLEEDHLLQAKETLKKVRKAVNDVFEKSCQLDLVDYEKTNTGNDFILRAFLNSDDFEILKIGPDILGIEITYTTRSPEDFSDDDSVSSEEDDDFVTTPQD